MLDERVKKDLTDLYQTMQVRGELLSHTQLNAYHATDSEAGGRTASLDPTLNEDLPG